MNSASKSGITGAAASDCRFACDGGVRATRPRARGILVRDLRLVSGVAQLGETPDVAQKSSPDPLKTR